MVSSKHWPTPKSVYMVNSRRYGSLMPDPSPDADDLFNGIELSSINRKYGERGIPLTPLELIHNVAYGNMIRLSGNHFTVPTELLPLFAGLPDVEFKQCIVSDWFNFECYYWWEGDRPMGASNWPKELRDPRCNDGLLHPHRVSEAYRVSNPGYDLFEVLAPRHKDIFQSYDESPMVLLEHQSFITLYEDTVRASPRMFSEYPMLRSCHNILHPALMRRIAPFIDPRFLIVLRWDLSEIDNPTLTEIVDMSTFQQQGNVRDDMG